jgi:ABC-type branched-subunit amino acid transport system substrate-binding protein
VRAVPALAAGVLLATAVACSSSGSSSSGGAAASSGTIPAGPIKVGLITPLSGQLAGYGTGIKAGISAFVDQVNASGGVDGHQLELITENDENDPATGVAAAEKLKSQGVVVTFGAGLGQVVPQVLPVLMKEKILVIFNEATDTYTAEVGKYPYYFSGEPSDGYDMANMARYAKSQGITKVGTISDGLPPSVMLREDFVAAAQQEGLTVAAQVSFAPTAVDLSTQVAELKAAGVQAVTTTNETQYAPLYAAFKQLNWDPLVLGTAFTPISVPVDAPANTVYPCVAPLTKGQPAPAGTVSAISVLNKAGAGGTAPDAAPIYRDEVQLFVKAVKTAGSLDPDKLKAAIESFKSVTFTAPQYSYTFTAASHAGWAGDEGQCHLTPVSAIGLPYQIATS